jgi:hypothetical protein
MVSDRWGKYSRQFVACPTKPRLCVTVCPRAGEVGSIRGPFLCLFAAIPGSDRVAQLGGRLMVGRNEQRRF